MEEKIALLTVSPVSHRTAEETLALGYLASSLRRAGYCNVKIIDGWLRGLTNEDLMKIAFDGGTPSVIGISCYRSSLDRIKSFIDIVKNRANGDKKRSVGVS